jgi:two-component system chemotaxis response regulator CheY
VIKKLPFIMATGQRDKDQVKQAIDAGVNNYIVKPFSVADLRKRVAAVLGPLT